MLNDKMRTQLVILGADCILRQLLQLMYHGHEDV